ncbi:IclR family transcriptional regulator [Nonomuraea insulae]|uniref:IclR family transcriptional regulator n=1 Tax=Nonomuraea insulae TaxID=1616787 RepID=A0ABW1DAH1_9ACTN
MYSPASEGRESDSAFLSTLANGLKVFEVLTEQRATLRALTEAVGLPRQTVYRIVHTLEVLGWVERRASDDTYAPTVRMWAIGARSHGATELRVQWANLVSRLAEKIGETVHLAVYDQGCSVYIDKRDGWHPIGSYTKLGGRSPAHCVATGKALLAHQPPWVPEQLLNAGLRHYTDTTITEPAALQAELEGVRRQGFAMNNGEYRAEVGGVAVPIRSPLGDVVAALGFSGPVDRIQDRKDELVTILLNAVSGIPAQPPTES